MTEYLNWLLVSLEKFPFSFWAKACSYLTLLHCWQCTFWEVFSVLSEDVRLTSNRLFFFCSLSPSDFSNSVNVSGLVIPLGGKTSEELSLWLGSSYIPNLYPTKTLWRLCCTLLFTAGEQSLLLNYCFQEKVFQHCLITIDFSDRAPTVIEYTIWTKE